MLYCYKCNKFRCDNPSEHYGEEYTLTSASKIYDENFQEAYSYADYILNHYNRDSKADKLVLAKDLLKHGWVK